jgi:hypothetical protein
LFLEAPRPPLCLVQPTPEIDFELEQDGRTKSVMRQCRASAMSRSLIAETPARPTLPMPDRRFAHTKHLRKLRLTEAALTTASGDPLTELGVSHEYSSP